MTAKRWVGLFLVSAAMAAAVLVGFNVLMDPFGVFGDPLLDWYGYNETQNPRAAKTVWLQDRHQDYDSYIIGCSGSSSIPTEALNRALDARFYNMIMYGADLEDVEKTAQYLVDRYEVKNLVISLYVDNATQYSVGEDSLYQRLHPDVSGANPWEFYLNYLFLAPRHGMEKLRAWRQDTDLPQAFDVFDTVTGAYDKRLRDVEPIGDMDTYLKDYPVFAEYPAAHYTMTEIDNCIRSLTAIRDLCDARGIRLFVVQNPVYTDHLAYYDPEDLRAFYTAIAEVVPFWDFTDSSVSRDPRYFYDETHFRNAVGEMMVARMFGDEGVYVPEDFGRYVAGPSEMESVGSSGLGTDHTARVPVLLYHALDETGEGDMSVTPETFRAHMEALKAAGYTAVSLQALYDYVCCGTPLPEKPVVLTFDDGYASNYEIAYPILKELDLPAAIFVIGVSVGKDTYKDTGLPMTPHFGWEEAREMVESGLVTIGTHTYDMHQWPPLEPEGARLRENALPRPGESEADYLAVCGADLSRALAELEEGTGQPCLALAYPYGLSAPETWAAVDAQDIPLTFGTEPRSNTLIQGLPQCLLNLGRFTIDDIAPDELLVLLEAA